MKFKMLLASVTTACMLVGMSCAVYSQNRSTSPTAELDDPKKWEDIAPARGGAQDSRLAGGSGGVVFPESRVTLPSKCEIDPHAYGCPGFCDANPQGLGCPVPPAPAPPAAETPPPAVTPYLSCSCYGQAYNPHNGGYTLAIAQYATYDECDTPANRGIGMCVGDDSHMRDPSPGAGCFSLVSYNAFNQPPQQCM